MLTESEAREVANKVVSAAKNTAHVDTGALKRSISYTYVKGEIIFRQLFYGAFGENSLLEDLANKIIPKGQAWKVILTSFNGETVEVGKKSSGRRTRNTTTKYNPVQTTEKIKKLISSVVAARKKRESEEEFE